MRMSKTVVSLVASGLLGAWMVTAPQAAPVPAEAGKSSEKWEYGELRGGFQPASASGDAGGPKVYHPAKATVQWVTRKETVEVTFEAKYRDLPELKQQPGGLAPSPKAVFEAVVWGQMLKKLKAPEPDKKAPKISDRIRVFNRLGEGGWELAAYQPADQYEGTAAIWVFKRRTK